MTWHEQLDLSVGSSWVVQHGQLSAKLGQLQAIKHAAGSLTSWHAIGAMLAEHYQRMSNRVGLVGISYLMGSLARWHN